MAVIHEGDQTLADVLVPYPVTMHIYIYIGHPTIWIQSTT